MNRKNNESLFKKQRNVRPVIEDAVSEALNGDTLTNAQNFISYLRKNKMTPGWASANSWKVSYKGKGVYYIRLPGTAWYPLDADSWNLSVFAQYDENLRELISGESEEIKELVHANNNFPCGGCMSGLDRKSVSKNFSNICACTCINIKNPDDSLCGFAIKLIALRREAITNDRVPKCCYVKPSK